MYAALLIAVLVGGGVSAAAEGSLPGDALYGVKVNVNEEVRSAVTISDEAQASWDAHRAERRLEETEKLAAEGRLDAETSSYLEARFEKHAQDVAMHADASANIAARAAVQSDLEATLEAHDTLLRVLMDSDKELEDTLVAVHTSVLVHADAAEQSRKATEIELAASGSAQAIAKERKEAVEEKMETLEGAVASLEGSVDADISAELTQKLGATADAYATGETLTESGEYGRAFASFQESLRTATEAEVLLTGSAVFTHEQNRDKNDDMMEPSTDPDVEIQNGAEINFENEGSAGDEEGISINLNEEVSLLQEINAQVGL